MKVGELLRFRKTGIFGVVTEVEDMEFDDMDDRVKVFSTYEDDETHEQVQISQWYTLDYLLDCSEPADFDHAAMRGGRL
jgi:hypothetical protein